MVEKNMARNQLQMAKRRRNAPDRLVIGLLVAFGIVGIITAVLAFRVVRSMASSLPTGDLPGSPLINVSEQATAIAKDPNSNVPLQAVAAGPEPEPWDGVSRINILMMGLDYRDWEAGETPRTDTMMLVTLDPLTKSAGMLSIPRDMWVPIPGHDHAKINTAYYLGEIEKLPGGGPALAAKTVEQFLGVPINYYAQVDFMAFVKIIDSMGGLTMHIRQEITVDPVGPGNTVTLREGVQDLDGATVLAYARMRYTEGGDFDRAVRQQDVIMAIRDQVLTLNMLPTLIAKSPQIYQDVASGIRTNLNLQQVIQLAMLASQVDIKAIKKGVIGPPDQVMLGTSPDGLSIAIPVPDRIRLLRDEIFTAGGPVGPSVVTADAAELVKNEGARVIVQNGSDIPGLAGRTAEYFRSLGVNVVEESNADRVYGNSTLVILNGKPNTAKYLADMMKVATGNIFHQYTPDGNADLIVIVGNDWGQANPMP